MKENTNEITTDNLIPDTFPLGPKGPGQAEVDKLKKEFGRIKACTVAGAVYIFRMMLREEYLAMQEGIGQRMAAGDTDFDVDAELAANYTIWPAKVNWPEAPGGVVTILTQEISKFDGFTMDQESIEL